MNTKQISKQGLKDKLIEEYGYCDDLYNHFTIRGLELLKKGGYLSYITSDTFLTLQSKENLRRAFLGIHAANPQHQEGNGQVSLMDGLDEVPDCHLLEVINTPKAFAALVDTAIFTIQRAPLHKSAKVTYIDLRYPSAESFGISDEEWELIKANKENATGWERVLDRTFSEVGIATQEQWQHSHNCDGASVEVDKASRLQQYRTDHSVYQKAIGYAVFAPNAYNCQLLERVVKPIRPVFDQWWSRVESSRAFNENREAIQEKIRTLVAGDVVLVGMLADGGQGMATGNNGQFVA